MPNAYYFGILILNTDFYTLKGVTAKQDKQTTIKTRHATRT